MNVIYLSILNTALKHLWPFTLFDHNVRPSKQHGKTQRNRAFLQYIFGHIFEWEVEEIASSHPQDPSPLDQVFLQNETYKQSTGDNFLVLDKNVKIIYITITMKLWFHWLRFNSHISSWQYLLEREHHAGSLPFLYKIPNKTKPKQKIKLHSFYLVWWINL